MPHTSRLRRPSTLLSIAAVILACAIGASTVRASGSSPTTTIAKLESMPDGLRIWTDSPVSNPDGCSATGFYLLPLSHADYETARSMAVAAFLAGSQVSFWLSGCSTTGGQAVPRIWSLRLHR